MIFFSFICDISGGEAMKKLLLRIYPAKVILILLQITLFQSALNAAIACSSDSTAFYGAEYARPWQNTVYISTGWGLPQGLRTEIGYNLGSLLSIGMAYGGGQNWGYDKSRTMIGLLGSLRFPLQNNQITPYLLVCTGSTITPLFGHNDTYTLLYAGTIITLKPWLQFKPEAGLIYTSAYVSGGGSIWGSNSPVITQDELKLGFHASFEINLNQL